MVKPILWKEWQEQRWKLAFGSVMLGSLTWAFFASHVVSNQEVIVGVWIVGGTLLALHTAMGVFAPERSAGTTTFLLSKPILPSRAFACKWIMGWLSLAVPLSVCGIGMAMATRVGPQAGSISLGFLAIGTLRAMATSTVIYSLTCCLSPRKSEEGGTGLVGLSLVAAMFLHFSIGPHGSVIQQVAKAINPLYFAFPAHVSLMLLIPGQACLLALSLWIGLRKWERSA